MLTKFLYGKIEHLSEFLKGKCSPRFSDISHYSRLENILMRDNEMRKDFFIDKNDVQINIYGKLITANNKNSPRKIAYQDRHGLQDHPRFVSLVLSAADLYNDPRITVTPRHCYCLCLSNKKNDSDLFSKFNADICIEINIEKLIWLLTETAKHHLPGTKIVNKEVIYYQYHNGINALSFANPEEAVFLKPDIFAHEDEYRIALFYPLTKSGFKLDNNEIVPFYRENESQHLHIKCRDKRLIKDMIVGFYSP